MLPTVGIPHLD